MISLFLPFCLVFKTLFKPYSLLKLAIHNVLILEKENNNLKREVKSLTTRNQNLSAENNKLRNYIDAILDVIKKFFRKILQFANEYAKDEATIEIKDYYDNNDFDMNDLIKVSRGTTKQDELFDYVDAPDYLKTRVKDYDDYDKDYDKSDGFDMSR